MFNLVHRNSLPTFGNYFEKLFDDVNDFSSHGIEYLETKEGTLLVSIDIPGIKEEDLNIEVVENTINVSGSRKTATSSSTMRKSFTVPRGYKSDDVKADLKDGVLTLTLISLNKEIKKISISKQ